MPQPLFQILLLATLLLKTIKCEELKELLKKQELIN